MNRVVRTTPQFWNTLDHALPTGTDPSWHDFASWELPTVVERVAAEWDVMARFIPGRDDYRVLFGAGRFGAWAVEAQAAQDGAVELVSIEIDVLPPWSSDDDPDEELS